MINKSGLLFLRNNERITLRCEHVMYIDNISLVYTR